MKLPPLTAYVHNIGGIESVTRGFRQQVTLWIPEAKDEMETVVRKEQFFRIEIWSNSQTDSRFLDSRAIKSKVKAVCYLNGERWMSAGASDWSYALKLKLQEWQKA